MKDLALLNSIIDAYFEQHPDVDKIPVTELMPQFVKARIFDKDTKKGLPVRRLLRALDRSNELHLIPTVLAERTEENVAWFFNRTKLPDPDAS